TLRVIKNRFGPANEVGVFEMTGNGLIDVQNPSHFFIKDLGENRIGSSITCSMEGTRPILLEVQALVSKMSFGMPQRSATGIDPKRLSLIIAVLEKRAALILGNQDIHVNIAGGIRVMETAADISIAAALISSFLNRPTPENTLTLGELGLGGEVRTIPQLETRLKEAHKLKFKRIILPDKSLQKLKKPGDIEFIGLKDISQLLEII
ncbi:MAG: magnesium chelatase domain-containing protein, partial [bacterium]